MESRAKPLLSERVGGIRHIAMTGTSDSISAVLKVEEPLVSTGKWMINARHAPPPPVDRALHRRHILNLSEAGRHRRLLLIQAPAGFGKSVFLSQWHEVVLSSGGLCAWASLETVDSAPDAFMATIALSLACASILTTDDLPLPSAECSPMEALDALAGQMQSVRRETWLMIDNWHLAQSPDTIRLLELLLNRLPANWHIAIASRVPPRLALAAFRASSQLVEIGANDLRFSGDDLPELLRGVDYAPIDLQAFMNATFGWPIAVRLACLDVDAARNLGTAHGRSALDAIEGISDYLESEIYAPLNEDVRHFLLEISIFRRFNDDIVTFVREKPDTPLMMDALKPLRGLVMGAVNGSDWLYFHPMLATFLDRRRHMVEEVKLRQLHKRAALWFENHGQLDDAVHHALEGGDQAHSIHLVESANCLDLCIRNGAPAVHSLLEKLPEHVVQDRPRLRAAHAAISLKRGSIAEARSLTSELRQNLGAMCNDDALARDIFILENLSLCFIDTSPSPEEITAYRLEISNANSEEWWINALRYNVYGRLEMRAGHLKEALGALQKAFVILESGQSAHGCFFMSVHIAFCHLFMGKLQAAEDSLRTAKTILERDLGSDIVYACIANSAEALLYYERNELSDAGRLAQAALSGLEQAEGCFEQYLISVYVGASSAFALTGLDSALKIISRGRKLALFHGLHVMDRILVGLAAGFHARAGQWHAEAITRFSDGSALECAWLEADLSAPVRALIARRTDRQDKTREDAAASISQCNAAGRVPAEVRAYLTIALIYAEDGDTLSAQDALGQAVTLASQEMLFQPFFETGDHMLPLLRELSKKAPVRMNPFAASFLSSLILRMVATRKAREHGETLTVRERQILAHLNDGVSRKEITSNKEIARALNLTENAVKFHLKNIFRKLDVKNRDMAAAVARLLNSDRAGQKPWGEQEVPAVHIDHT